ncbi:MAG: glycosyltransferase family 39 protein [Elusimicrobiota bacterium]|nr:glycosyltransferase family 39 protein [Elusimicrobiota bacterium]
MPFFNKAISGDSIFYIYTAKQILRDPLKPFDFQINCAEKNYYGWDVANNPPLISYFLAGIIKIFGENEKILHIIFFCFTILSVLGVYFLSKELKIDPLYSSLLLIASPAFFVNATDIMLDIPMLAFSLWGIYFAICSPRLVAPDFSRGGVSPAQVHCGVNSANKTALGWILLGLAVLIKFVAIINLPVVFAWFLLKKKLKKNLIFFLIPILFLIVWSMHNKLVYSEIQIFKKSLSVGLFFGIVKEIPLLTYLGGAFIFPLSILWLTFKYNKVYIWFFIILFSLVNLFFNLLGYSNFQNLFLGVFISSSVILIFIFAEHLKKTNFQNEIVFLVFWFFLYFLFLASVSAIIAVRYLLPLLPPVIMLLVKISEKVSGRKVFLTITVAAGIILSLFLAHSDYILANSYREIANYLKSNYTGKIYFRGDMSFRGFQYYMEKSGFICLSESIADSLSGNYLIASIFSVRTKLNPEIKKNIKFVEEKYVFTKNPFRTMSPSTNAGFHLNLYGLLPYSVSKMPLEKFTIYKIQ